MLKTKLTVAKEEEEEEEEPSTSSTNIETSGEDNPKLQQLCQQLCRKIVPIIREQVYQDLYLRIRQEGMYQTEEPRAESDKQANAVSQHNPKHNKEAFLKTLVSNTLVIYFAELSANSSKNFIEANTENPNIKSFEQGTFFNTFLLGIAVTIATTLFEISCDSLLNFFRKKGAAVMTPTNAASSSVHTNTPSSNTTISMEPDLKAPLLPSCSQTDLKSDIQYIPNGTTKYNTMLMGTSPTLFGICSALGTKKEVPLFESKKPQPK